MKKMIFVLLAALVTLNTLAADVTPAADLPTYYKSVNGKSGQNLWDAVHSVSLIGYKSLSYDGLWTAFKTTDVYPAGHARAGQIWDMYSDCQFKKQCGSYSVECDCYNREHSIPKSWWGGGTSDQGCDIFHLVPTDGKVNGMRSNYAFGEVETASYNYDGSKLGTGKTIVTKNTIAGDIMASAPDKVFEPVDEYKGDFARGYFGTLLHWTSVSMTQGDGAEIFSSSKNASGNWGLTKYGLALLLKWHRQDPVSQKEIDRNNGIQKTQGNRNPFIDYPELAEYIWGAHAGETFTINSGDTPGEVCTKLATPNVTATAGDGQVTLAWTAVNGATNYTVTISAGEGFTTECLTEAVISNVTTNGSNCTCVISGLTNGLTYTTTVIAVANDKTCDSDADTDKVTPQKDAVIEYADYKVKHYQQNIDDNLYTLFETEDFNGLVGTQVTPAVKNYTGFVAPATQTKAITADGNMVINYNYNRQTYQIRFLNETVVLQDEQLKYGDTPVYKGDTPTKAETEQYIYTFDSWEPEVTLVTKSQDYVAFFIGEEKHSTAISTIVADKNDIRKVMINGLLFIQRGGHIYDVTGRLVK